MKFEVDIDLDALAAAVAPKVAALLAKPAAADKAPAKPAKPAAKPAAAKEVAKAPTPERDAVHGALRDYMQANGKDAALAVLHKYAPTINELAEDKFATVIAELKGEAAPPPAAAEDDDPFV